MDKRRFKKMVKEIERNKQRSSSLQVPDVIDAKAAIECCDIEKRNKRRITEHMSKRIRRIKTAIPLQQPLLLQRHDDKIDMSDFARKCSAIPMSRFLERDIRRKIRAPALEQAHSKLLDDIMIEVRREFSKITHQAGIGMKTKSAENILLKTKILPCKFLGKTENYPKYLAIRKKVESIWMLHCPLHRNILKDCVTKLPYTLVDLYSNQSTRLRTLDEFEAELEEHISDASRCLKDFYRGIQYSLDEEASNLGSFEPSRYYGACTRLVSVHLSRTIAHTMLQLVKYTDSEASSIPYLILHISFEDRAILRPEPDEIVALYTNFLKKLINIGSQFYVLERIKIRGHESKKIHLCITEEFLETCIEQMVNNIRKCFGPILGYLGKLNGKFRDIYEDVVLGKDKHFSDIVFKEGYEQIIHYKAYLLKIFYVPTKEYFSIGQVLLSDFVEIIIKGLKNLIDNIFGKLAAQHEYEANDINETCRLIYYRARKDPATTEELIEITKYMAWVREEYLEELNNRVFNSLVDLCSLITLGPLSERHMDLNSTNINWLDKIPPILDQNYVNFDQLKFDAEENLQKVIEDVNDAVKAIYPLLDILNDMSDVTSVKSYLNFINLHMIKMKEIEKQISWINQEEVCLSFPKSTYSEYEDLKNYVYPFYHLLKLCLDVQRSLSVWQDGQFDLLCYDSTKEKLEQFEADLTIIQKNYRNELRQSQEDNTAVKFKGTVDDPDILNWPAPLKLCGKALLLVKGFKPSLNVMKIMCNPALKKRHWCEMSKIAGFKMEPNAGTTLRKLMKIDFGTNLATYEIISIGASKEANLLNRLDKMKTNWSNVDFSLSIDEATGDEILTRFEDIQELIDDNVIKVMNMRSSVFVKPYETDVSDFHQKLQVIDMTLDECIIVQDTWLHLLPILSEKNIANKIPDITELFLEVDTIYKAYKNKVIEDQNVMKVAEDGKFLEILLECKDKLEIVHKGICNYIEDIRLYFPRLFFLSIDEVIVILSKADQFPVLETYLKKLFTSVTSLVLRDGKVLGVKNKEGEKLVFHEYANINETNGRIEELLKTLEKKIFSSVENSIRNCFADFSPESMERWILTWPCQFLLMISQITWTSDIHRSIDNVGLKQQDSNMKLKLSKLLKMVNNDEVSLLTRHKLKTLITEMIHQRNVISELILKNVKDKDEFSWLAQLKYYLSDGKCLVNSLYTSIPYGNEYIDSSEKLIITPLTDRCHRTLLSAYHIHLYGSPIGPAGTGKTETVKDLAKLLGKLCVVFSCSDGIHHTTITRFIKGIAASGAWLALDEFNRITIDVTSVISQSILTLQLAVKSKSPKITVDDCQFLLDRSCFICITMNPGYPGRSRLPENLKVLFRNVAMMVPDSLIIAEVSLISYGFNDAKESSSKIVSAFRFMSEMFSTEKHYDFGIRTLKAILTECDKRKRENRQDKEDLIILKAIRRTTAPRLVKDDIIIFESILGSLFPGIEVPLSREPSLTEAAANYSTIYDASFTDMLTMKMQECYDILHIRQGIIFVGGPASGKSMTIKTLANVLDHKLKEDMKANVSYKIINPKSVTLEQLYGTYDHERQRWHDGIVSRCFREYAQNFSDVPKWIIFDGPIDTVWVENVNSVLDDNRKLCLGSGEMISGDSSISFFFEVTNLDKASPATVSRCGVIYMEQSPNSWDWTANSWIRKCNHSWFLSNKDHIVSLIKWAIPGLLDITRTLPNQYNILDLNSVRKTLQIFEAFINDALQASMKKEEDLKNIRSWVQASFIQASVFGFCSLLNTDNIQKFDESFRVLWKGQDSKHPYPESIERMEVAVPSEGLLIDFTYIYKMKGNWKTISDVIKTEKISESLFSQHILVPTIDSYRQFLILHIHIRNRLPLLFVGPSGSGKTITLQDFLINKLSNECYMPEFFFLTRSTTSNKIQKLLMSKLNKKKHGHYGPPDKKTSVIFFDDLNMAGKDTYGSQDVLELLRQHLDHNIWYDLTTMSPVYLDDIILTAAMTLTSNSLTCQRFLRHFSIFSVNEYTQEVIFKIYSNYLTHVWKKAGFPSDIAISISQITHGTLSLYDNIRKNFKPSFENPLYTFNLFDLDKIIKGCTLLRKETSDVNKRIFPKIWTHEVLRVIGDRVLDDSHRVSINDCLKGVIEDHFQEEFNDLFENLMVSNDAKVDLDSLMFGMNYDKATDDSFKYDELTLEELREICSTFVVDYNTNHPAKIDIVLFKSAIINISRIAHTLTLPGRSVILIGLSGTGRKTSTYLATLLLKQNLLQPIASDNLSQDEWNKAVKNVLIAAGAEAKKSVFLVDDFRFDSEYLFGDINYVLNFTDLQSLFSLDEQRKILEMTRIQAQGGNKNLDISAPSVFLFFNKSCKENLHIVLCVSSVSRELRRMSQKYPSILKYCDKISMGIWPDEAYASITQTRIDKINLSDEIKLKTLEACNYIHKYSHQLSLNSYNSTGIKNYVTTIPYLECIRTYVRIITEKQNDLTALRKRYSIGLDKLSFAASQISKMQQSLAEYQPQLKDMTERAKEMTEQIATETIEVEKASALVKIDEKIANEQAIAANFLKIDCEADLAQAIPILEDAISALNTLKPSDITLVKSMKNPPDAIKLVMAAVCVIKDVKPDRIPDPSTGRKTIDYWGPSKRILGDMNFLQTLKDFDKDHIKPEIMVKIRKEYLPHKDFLPHIVAKASSAAEGLCKWIIAMDMYDKVAKEVAPKKEKLEKAEKEYAQTVAILNEKKEEVARIEAKLATLNSLLEEAKRKQQILQKEVDLCNKRLSRAQTLIGGLGGEKERWTNITKRLQDHYNNLGGDILISCAVVSYLSPFGPEHRKEAIGDWHSYMKTNLIPCSEKFDFTQVLGSEGTVQNWHINCLPVDNFFIENAIIFSYTTRYSLFKDPHYLGKTWVQTTEKRNDLHIVKISDRDFMKEIKTCINAGIPVLLEGIKEKLHPALEPILCRQILKNEGRVYTSFAGKIQEYNENFRLYLTSYLRDPQYEPDIFTKVCLIDFSLTTNSLGNMLLDTIISIEEPKLEKQRASLGSENIKNREDLKEMEEKILQTLFESKSDILEDERALKILDDSKNVSNDIRMRQKRVRNKEEEIETFKKGYANVAYHGVILYETISQLYKINFMYQYSLNWFLNIFTTSLQTAEKSRILTKRCENLKNKTTIDVYDRTTVSLYVKDRLVFSFYVCVKLNVLQNKVSSRELDFFIKIAKTDTKSDAVEECDWPGPKVWSKIQQLSELDDAFKDFPENVKDNSKFYQDLITKLQFKNIDLPFEWYGKLNSFQRLLVISCLGLDKISNSVFSYIEQEMGRKFVEPVKFDISSLYNLSHNLCPLIFLLTRNTDPMVVLLKFAKVKHVLHKLYTVSLGKDQNDRAVDLIRKAQTEGTWVCLQNCHLVTTSIAKLESTFESMTYENTHENFRLWLTTDCFENLPLPIIQNSIKMVNEPLNGLKHNLQNIYTQHPIANENFYNSCPGRVDVFARLLYSISVFHVVIEERKKFGAIGWNIPYEFKSVDFSIATKHLQIFLNQYENPLEALLYIIGECDYGGRVSDDWDQRLFNTILQDYLNENIVRYNSHLLLDKGFKYGFPAKNFHKDYVRHISKLPEEDPTELFGLHENVRYSKELAESKYFLSNLGIFDRSFKLTKDWNKNVIEPIILEIVENLQQIGIKQNLSDSIFKTILSREIEQYNILFLIMKSSLERVLVSLEGNAFICDEFEDIVNSALDNRIPKLWIKHSYPSLYNLSDYLEDFRVRVRKLNTSTQNFYEECVWFPMFFFPNAFLATSEQYFSCQAKIPINKISIRYEVFDDDTYPRNELGICGLYMEGARWDYKGKCIGELLPNMIHCEMPMLIMKPEITSEFARDVEFKIPVYRTPERQGVISTSGHSSNYIFAMYLKTKINPSHWIKRGAALVCQIRKYRQ